MWLRQCWVPVKCCCNFIVTLCSTFCFRVEYIYLAEWFGRWWIFLFRDLYFYRDCQSKSCGILNVIAPMLNILNAIVVEFYRDSLQYFLFQSRIYIYLEWFGIEYESFIFLICDLYLIVISNRNLGCRIWWIRHLQDILFRFSEWNIYIWSSDSENGESFIFLICDLSYRDSQSKSWMSNLWWIRRLQNILFRFSK